MGIILKQSAKNLVTTYVGFGVGAINTLFLYTNLLEQEYYGLVSFLLSAANLVWPLMAFGMHNTLVKFYSSYDAEKDKDRLLTLVLFMPLLIALIIGTLGISSFDLILKYFSGENDLVQPYIWLIYLIAVATAYFEIFFSWSKIHHRSVFGNLMREVFHRICISVLLLGVYFEWISVETFIYALGGVFLLRALLMKLYAFSLYLPNLEFSLPENSASVLKYSALILIAGSVAVALLDLDKVMIEHYLPIENVAVYGIAIYIASVIAVPSRAMHQITYPLTAILLNKKDTQGLKDLYRKSSINLLVIGGFVFLLIITNLHEIYALIPREYQLPFAIVVLISSVKLYDNLLGNNNSILFNSDYYRMVLFIGLALAVMAFILNMVFIPHWKLMGAAMATFLAFALYNTFKVYIVYWKFGIHPFTPRTAVALLLVLVFSFGFYFWNFDFHPITNIVLKSMIMAILYLPAIYLLKLSEDINRLLNRILLSK